MAENSSSSSGIGFCGLLTVLFVGLKLLEKIDWSWLWVLSPLWIPVATCLAFALLFLIGFCFCMLFSYLNGKRKKGKSK